MTEEALLPSCLATTVALVLAWLVVGEVAVMLRGRLLKFGSWRRTLVGSLHN